MIAARTARLPSPLVAAAGLGLFAFSWIWMSKPMDVLPGIFLMTAVQLVAIGLLADLIDKRSLR